MNPLPVKQGETLATTGHTPTADSLIQIQRAAESLTYRWSSPQWRSQSSATPKMAAAGGFHRAAHSSPQQPLPMLMMIPRPFQTQIEDLPGTFYGCVEGSDSSLG